MLCGGHRTEKRDRLDEADKEAQEMFSWLVSAEKSHERNLLETYEALTGARPDFEKLR